MPSLFRIIEVVVYSLLNFLPFLVLALYPFRHSLRFSKGVTGLLSGLLTIIQVLIGICVVFVPGNYAAIASAISTTLNSPVVEAFRDVCKENHIMAVPDIYLYENGKCYDADILINRDGQITGIQKMVHVTQAD